MTATYAHEGTDTTEQRVGDEVLVAFAEGDADRATLTETHEWSPLVTLPDGTQRRFPIESVIFMDRGA